MSVLRDLQNRAAARPAHIVLSEGHDPRVVAGALAALEAGMGPITLVGPAAEISLQLERAGATGSQAINIQDPETSPLTAHYASLYLELRKPKGISEENCCSSTSVSSRRRHETIVRHSGSCTLARSWVSSAA